VSSTDTGVIFGQVAYDKGADASENIVSVFLFSRAYCRLTKTSSLSDIHVEILDFIKPHYCSEAQVSRTRSSLPQLTP